MPKKAKKKKKKGKKGKKKKVDMTIWGCLFPEFQGSSYQQKIDHIRWLWGELINARLDNRNPEDIQNQEEMRFTHSSDFGERKTVTLSLYAQQKPLPKQNPTENELFGQDHSLSLINKSYQHTKVVAPPALPPVKGQKPGPPPRPKSRSWII